MCMLTAKEWGDTEFRNQNPIRDLKFSDALTLWIHMCQRPTFMEFARAYRLTDEWILDTPHPQIKSNRKSRYDMWCRRGTFFANLLFDSYEFPPKKIVFVVKTLIETAPGLMQAWGVSNTDPWKAMATEKQGGDIVDLAYFFHTLGAVMINTNTERPDGSASMVAETREAFVDLNLGIDLDDTPDVPDPSKPEGPVKIESRGAMSADEKEANGFVPEDEPKDRPSASI